MISTALVEHALTATVAHCQNLHRALAPTSATIMVYGFFVMQLLATRLADHLGRYPYPYPQKG